MGSSDTPAIAEDSAVAPPPAPIMLRRAISGDRAGGGANDLLRIQPPDLARLTSTPLDRSTSGSNQLGPPVLVRETSFAATRKLFQDDTWRQQLDLAQKAFADSKRVAEESAEKAYAAELKDIELKLDEEAEKLLEENPIVSSEGASWDFQRSRLPGGCESWPDHRFDFEVDPDSIVPGRKKCIVQPAAGLLVGIPAALAPASQSDAAAASSGITTYSLTVFFLLPDEWKPSSGTLTRCFRFRAGTPQLGARAEQRSCFCTTDN